MSEGDDPTTPGRVTPSPPPIAAFRSARPRAASAIVALALITLQSIVEVWHYLRFDGLVADVVSGAAGATEAGAYDQMTLNLGLLYLFLYLVTAVAFIAWLSRAVANVPALGAGQTQRTARGAIGWWFVPFANLVVPYGIVRDLHDRLATALDGEKARVLLLGWWATWVGSNLVASAISLGRPPTDTLDQLKATIYIQIGLDTGLILSGLLAILVVRRIQRREDAWAAAHPAPVPVIA